MKIKLLVLPLILFSAKLAAQLVTSNTMTPTQLVNQVLLGTGVTASNVTFVGDVKQRTKFVASASTGLGIASGIFLSTGDGLSSSASGPQGPNNATSTSTDFNNPGDPLLSLVSTNATFDAAILEFDFVPMGDSLKFRYCFGSEEYLEFVNAGVNDVFGFFLSGPNPAGGNYVNHNVAIVPGTTTPVSIDDVNNASNAAFFRDNTSNAFNVEFDGLTTVMLAREKVVCGQTYHIKIAIADGGDGVYDSGVFLEGGSFSSAPPISVSSLNSNASLSDTVLVEDCNTNCVYFVRGGSKTQKDSFMLQVSGNAVLGSDYIQQGNTSFNWPGKLVFAANQDTVRFCNLKALNDNLVEGTDTIIFTVNTYTSTANLCGASNAIRFKLYIRDYVPISIGQRDSTICNGQGVVLNANAQAGFPPYTYTWTPTGANTATLSTGVIAQPTNYTIKVNDFCNKPVQKQITITPSTLPVLDPIASYTICIDSVRKVPVLITGGKPPFSISLSLPPGGLAPSSTVNATYYFSPVGEPNAAGTYTVAVTDACGNANAVKFDLSTIDCRITVPNVVTVNGDNVNDYFRIRGLENFYGSSLLVYNRWGNQVYKSADYRNDWKPGMTAGTYFYVLEVSDGRKFNGFFELFN